MGSADHPRFGGGRGDRAHRGHYAGQIVEHASTAALLDALLHPHRGLMQSIPRLDQRRQRLELIPGTVPDARQFPSGCRFAPRCPLAEARCREQEQALEELAPGHWARCWKAGVCQA